MCIRDSSYGRLSWPPSLGRIVSVDMGVSTSYHGSDCPTDEMLTLAKAKVQDQHGIDAASYTHFELFIPTQIAGCAWQGYAPVGCCKAHEARRGGACWSMIRDGWAATRAHEFGHNIGLGHGGGNNSECTPSPAPTPRAPERAICAPWPRRPRTRAT